MFPSPGETDAQASHDTQNQSERMDRQVRTGAVESLLAGARPLRWYHQKVYTCFCSFKCGPVGSFLITETGVFLTLTTHLFSSMLYTYLYLSRAKTWKDCEPR